VAEEVDRSVGRGRRRRIAVLAFIVTWLLNDAIRVAIELGLGTEYRLHPEVSEFYRGTSAFWWSGVIALLVAVGVRIGAREIPTERKSAAQAARENNSIAGLRRVLGGRRQSSASLWWQNFWTPVLMGSGVFAAYLLYQVAARAA
jgi:hypothetical protein